MNQIASHAARIERLEGEFLRLPQAQCDVVHRFAPGLYIREVSIPANTYSIGHYQKTTHLNVMLKGRVTMVHPDGTEQELIAPLTFIAGPGRKVGYISEDMVWLNVYPTTETDVEKLEAMFIEKSPTFKAAQIHLLTNDRTADREDYHLMLAEECVSHQTANAQSLNLMDRRDFPPGAYKVCVAPSAIDGKGLFATSAIAAHEVIAAARLDGLRTPAGCYTNHSRDPNARMADNGDGDIYLMASRDIRGSMGGQLGEEITVDYRQALRVTRGLT